MSLRLHSYWRAAAPYRVRIALNLKGLAFDYAAVDLLAGAQRDPAYARLNPQRLTPVLETDDGLLLTQSLAIIEWLEETHPAPALLPAAAADRAVVRAMALLVACDIHPLNNVRVIDQLKALGVDGEGRKVWTQRWIADGFQAMEDKVAQYGGGFCFGDRPGLADCLLIPQIYGARRFGVEMDAFPHLLAVDRRAAALPAFAAAIPESQPDAPASGG